MRLPNNTPATSINGTTTIVSSVSLRDRKIISERPPRKLIMFCRNCATLTVVVCWMIVTSLVTRDVISPTRRSLKKRSERLCRCS